MKAIHPGRILRRELESREMSVNALAPALRTPSGRIVDNPQRQARHFAGDGVAIRPTARCSGSTRPAYRGRGQAGGSIEHDRPRRAADVLVPIQTF